MNYEFPHITNISQVLPAIEGRRSSRELISKRYRSWVVEEKVL